MQLDMALVDEQLLLDRALKLKQTAGNLEPDNDESK
jgi:hypothetical protein